MWALNKLPRFSNPVFTDPRFDRVTDDKFFVYVDAKDDRYNESDVKKLFDDSEYVADVIEDDTSNTFPRFVLVAWGGVDCIFNYSVADRREDARHQQPQPQDSMSFPTWTFRLREMHNKSPRCFKTIVR